MAGERLRILHTESSLGWGGQEIRVLTEARGVARRGHEVTLFAARGSRVEGWDGGDVRGRLRIVELAVEPCELWQSKQATFTAPFLVLGQVSFRSQPPWLLTALPWAEKALA